MSSAFGYGFQFQDEFQEVKGLTKREYFAGLAMQGLISNVDSDKYVVSEGEMTKTAESKAKFCILLADELLKQLENGN